MFMYFDTTLYGMPSLCCNFTTILLILKLVAEHYLSNYRETTEDNLSDYFI